MALRKKTYKKIALLFWLILAVLIIIYFIEPVDYYEYEADSKSDCIEGEKYDAEFRVCYFDFYCESDKECSEIDKAYESILLQIEEDYEKSDHTHEDDYVDFEDTEALEVFSILEGVPQLDEIENKKEAYIWNQIVAMMPPEYRNKITSFETYSRKWSSTMAYVEPIDESLEFWRMRYNLTSRNALPADMLPTLVHESAHIITLDNTQIDPDVSEDACLEMGRFYVSEGCATKDSYMQNFYTMFWGEEIAQSASFVSDYAQTNIGEDIAESFTFFVLRGDRETTNFKEKPGAEKVEFFYAYPDLVEMRKHMRSYIASISSDNL